MRADKVTTPLQGYLAARWVLLADNPDGELGPGVGAVRLGQRHPLQNGPM